MTSRNDVLLRWQTEEATVRARLAAPGVASPQDVKASSGIEFLQRIFNGELPSPPIGETLGFVPIAAGPDGSYFKESLTSATTIRSLDCVARNVSYVLINASSSSLTWFSASCICHAERPCRPSRWRP